MLKVKTYAEKILMKSGPLPGYETKVRLVFVPSNLPMALLEMTHNEYDPDKNTLTLFFKMKE